MFHRILFFGYRGLIAPASFTTVCTAASVAAPNATCTDIQSSKPGVYSYSQVQSCCANVKDPLFNSFCGTAQCTQEKETKRLRLLARETGTVAKPVEALSCTNIASNWAPFNFEQTGGSNCIDETSWQKPHDVAQFKKGIISEETFFGFSVLNGLSIRSNTMLIFYFFIFYFIFFDLDL